MTSKYHINILQNISVIYRIRGFHAREPWQLFGINQAHPWYVLKYLTITYPDGYNPVGSR